MWRLKVGTQKRQTSLRPHRRQYGIGEWFDTETPFVTFWHCCCYCFLLYGNLQYGMDTIEKKKQDVLFKHISIKLQTYVSSSIRYIFVWEFICLFTSSVPLILLLSLWNPMNQRIFEAKIFSIVLQLVRNLICTLFWQKQDVRLVLIKNQFWWRWCIF